MKKTLYIVILCLITAAAIIFGVVRVIQANVSNLFNFSGWGNWSKLLSSQEVVSEEGSLAPFHKVTIDMDVADVKILYGDDFKYEYDCSKDLVPTLEVVDDVLTVKQSDKVHSVVGNTKSKVILTIKKDTVIEKCDITADVGNVSVKGITMEQLTIKCDVGNINVDECDIERVKADADVGNVDIDLTNDLEDYAVTLSASVGNVKFQGKKVKMQYEKTGSSDKYIDVTADCGNIKVD